MKIIVTTSDRYLHILPIFIYLFNKNWSDKQEVEIVGYNKPEFELPLNFTFHSLGKQGSVEEFSTDLRKYFSKQDQWFIWMMEDSFIKSIDLAKLNILKALTVVGVGRINLSSECIKQDHVHYTTAFNFDIFENTQTANYRLSTRPSIWNKDFLMQYLKDGLTPWKFETQESINDGWKILGLGSEALEYNEGVRKNNINVYDLNGISDDQIDEMLKLNIL